MSDIEYETNEWLTEWFQLRDMARRLEVAVQIPPSLEARLRDYAARRNTVEHSVATCGALQVDNESGAPRAGACGFTYRTGEGWYDQCPRCDPGVAKHQALEDILCDERAYPGTGWWWCHWRGARGMWVHSDDAWPVERKDVEALCEAMGEKVFDINSAIFPAAVQETRRLQQEIRELRARVDDVVQLLSPLVPKEGP